MTTWTLQLRGLVFHRRMHLATLAGVVAAAAALTGALLVGDSMRGSLRDQALARLGPVEYAMAGPRLVGESLADRIAESTPDWRISPLLQAEASMTNARSQARAHRVSLMGVDLRFSKLGFVGELPSFEGGRSVALNQSLAAELDAIVGDDVLVRMESRGLVPTETLLGRRDENAVSLRLTVGHILPDDGPAGFSLGRSQRTPRNAFVPLSTLQRALKQPGRVNTILFAPVNGEGGDSLQGMAVALDRRIALADYDLSLRASDLGYASLESRKLLLEPPVESAALAAVQAIGATSSRVITYLANEIAVESADKSIPYSVVSAVEPNSASIPDGLPLIDGPLSGELGPRDILLNEWAVADLDAKVGDRIRLAYYVSRPMGRLETVETTFTLRGVVRMSGLGADRGYAPTYEGITDAKRLSDWKPPFPMDLKKIRPKDEEYWDTYNATPKAFVSLAAGQELWAESEGRFGRYTSIRILPTAGKNLEETSDLFTRELLKTLRPDEMGLAIRPVRAEALEAAEGSTDFGMLFIGFSSFLILAATLLVAMLFRFGVERRAGDVGILLATGYRVRRVSRLLVGEGSLLAVAGAVVGLAAALGYAWLMLAGLRSWWSAAVNAPFLRLHVTPHALVIGFAASVLVCIAAIVWAVRGLARTSPRALLAGALESGRAAVSPGKRRTIVILAAAGLLAAVGLVVLPKFTHAIPLVGAFFGSGAALLLSFLAGLWLWFTREPPPHHGSADFTRLTLAARSASRRPGRSLLAAGLVACATFVIVAVGASRSVPGESESAKESGTGGFSLVAESVVPLPYDLGSADGRATLGLSEETNRVLSNAPIVAFRAASGDDTSCLNLYKARQPRILGATPAMIERDGFAFSSTLAESPEEKSNPWRLLGRRFDDGAIPTIGDESAVRWLLHLGLGDDLIVQDERGRDVRLRIVAMLSGSILQGELIVAENAFLRMFPSASNYPFFLVESPPDRSPALAQFLERDLERYGLDVEPTARRLAAYVAVENTYLSTFQTLGGLGLLLGTLGLAAVAVRNMLERRGELALLRALGYRVTVLFWMALAEHATVLVAGLLSGTVAALVAVAPNLRATFVHAPWVSLGVSLAAVFGVGLATGAAALTPLLRTPLLPALRTE
ncbi:MAG TPA: FtsX-like permease family protein [Phycisphaerae bacterium]|nr:FtsX-like permease family protein [Phycisphaerae bacterium]